MFYSFIFFHCAKSEKDDDIKVSEVLPYSYPSNAKKKKRRTLTIQLWALGKAMLFQYPQCLQVTVQMQWES